VTAEELCVGFQRGDLLGGRIKLVWYRNIKSSKIIV